MDADKVIYLMTSGLGECSERPYSEAEELTLRFERSRSN